MKKIVTAAAVAVLLASCASAPSQAPKSAVATTPPTATDTPKVLTYQDPLPTLVKSYYPSGDLSRTVVTQYNDQGFLTKQETYNGNGVLTELRVGKAKDAVWRITITSGQTGEVISLEDRLYSPSGDLLSQTLLNPKEVPQAINEYQYDPSGRKTLWLTKTGEGGLQARTVYMYDAQGNNIRTEVYDAGGALGNLFQSTYDSANHIVSRVGYDAAGALREQTNFTWSANKKIKDETVKPLLRVVEYTYDDKSAPVSILTSIRGKTTERQTLEYQWFTRTRTLP